LRAAPTISLKYAKSAVHSAVRTHMDPLPDDHGPRALDSPGAHAAAFDLVLRGVWEDVPLALAAGMSVHARRDPYGSLTLLHVAARQGSTCRASPACVRMLVCVCVCVCVCMCA
jgi:hypothetical protein